MEAGEHSDAGICRASKMVGHSHYLCMIIYSHRTSCLVQHAVLYQNAGRNIFDTIPPSRLSRALINTMRGAPEGRCIPAVSSYGNPPSHLRALSLTLLSRAYVRLVDYFKQGRPCNVGRTSKTLRHGAQRASRLGTCARCGAILPQYRRMHAQPV